MTRSPFAVKFERAHRDVPMPQVYRDFILSDAYLPYRRAFVRGLPYYGPSDVEIRLDAPALLRPESLLDAAGLEPADAAGYLPIATLPHSAQWLAIDAGHDEAPVFLLHHETGAFHQVSACFTAFVAQLRTPQQVSRERAATRKVFADLVKACEPAARRARAALMAGHAGEAARVLDVALAGRRPIAYDGRNDFAALSALGACFNLQVVVRLKGHDLPAAQSAFLNAAECRSRVYCEAVLNLAVTSLLLGDTDPARAHATAVAPSDFSEPPSAIAARTFSAAQLETALSNAAAIPPNGLDRPLAAAVLHWFGLGAGPDAGHEPG